MTSQRDAAFQILNDKAEMAKAREKTQMCKFFLEGGKCTKSFCTYAHSQAELRVQRCLFFDDCDYITAEEPCLFAHPCDSTPQLYELRTGNPWPIATKKVAKKQTKEESWKQQCDARRAQQAQEAKAAHEAELERIKAELRKEFEEKASDPLVRDLTAQVKKLSWADAAEAEEEESRKRSLPQEEAADDETNIILEAPASPKAREESPKAREESPKAPSVSAKLVPSFAELPPVFSGKPTKKQKTVLVTLTPEQFAQMCPQLLAIGATFTTSD